ncbi:uncharacterized protein LOC129739855 isoform X1 [Uranotaenia lowii]|uniref:uncharacterized protein LOC129739855 isoform X1 n=1 Tax=Uranotaenia lowii TaxID=190385 RepID=UPI002478C3C8|nr:uncharacterized protein LOC129739855 isoform X1 [Uranotaenia lowii]
MDRPMTISEYSNWLLLIAAEDAACTQASQQIVEQVEKLVAFRDNVRQTIHQMKQNQAEIIEGIAETQRDVDCIREHLAEAEKELIRRSEENERLKLELAQEEEAAKRTAKAVLENDSEREQQLVQSKQSLSILRRLLSNSLTVDNVWNIQSEIGDENKLTEYLAKATLKDVEYDTVWDDLLKG